MLLYFTTYSLYEKKIKKFVISWKILKKVCDTTSLNTVEKTNKFRKSYENSNRNFSNYKWQFLLFLLINDRKLEQYSVRLLTSLQIGKIYNKINLISYG